MNFHVHIRILFAVTLIGISLQAQMPFTYIRGLDSIAKKEYLSPVHGLVWWRSHLIENLYRFGDQNTATVKLIQDLFYLQRDQVTFDITTLNRKPAKYFKPSTIGIIFQLVEQYLLQKQLSAEDKQQLAQQLQNAIAADINFSGLLEKAQNTVAQIQQEGEAASEIYKKFVRLAQLNKEKVALQEQLKVKGLSKKEVQALQAQVAEKNKELKSLGAKSKLEKAEEVKAIIRKIHQEDLTQASLKELITVLVDALDEVLRQDIYPAYTFHNILLGFLWKRVESRQELVPYFQHLYTNEEQQVEIVNAEQLEKLIEEQDPHVYTKEDYENIKNKLAEIIQTHDYELAVFGIIADNVWNNTLPPIVSSIASAVYKSSDQAYKFSDCGETSLRNFLNVILFDPVTSRFDLQRLSNKKISLSQPLHEFYSNTVYRTVESVTQQTTHNAWAQVVSALPGVTYWTPTKENGICEIGTGMDNMMRVINNLLFGNSPQFTAKTMSEKWDELVKAVSRKGFKLKWSASQEVDDVRYNDDNRISFSINKKPIFNWVFEKNHFFIEKGVDSEEIPSNPLLPSALIFKKHNAFLGMDILYLLSLTLNEIKEVINGMQKQIDQNLFLLSHIPINSDDKIEFIEFMIQQEIPIFKNKDLLLRLIMGLPQEERYIQAIASVMRYASWSYELLPSLYKNEKWETEVVGMIISNKILPYYDLARTWIKQNQSKINWYLIYNFLNNFDLLNEFKNEVVLFIDKQDITIRANQTRIFGMIQQIIKKKAEPLYDFVIHKFDVLDTRYKKMISDLIDKSDVVVLKEMMEKYRQEQTQSQQ